MIHSPLDGTFTQRTDLATECLDIVYGNKRSDDDGIQTFTETLGGITCTTVTVSSDIGAEKLGKPKGRYITADIGKAHALSQEQFWALCDVCSELLMRLIPKKGSCLMACLGNRNITADSQGPLCAESFIVTRHIKQHSPKLFSELSLRETACIAPDVSGNTGMEAADIIKGAADKIKPDFIIAVDSLAARSAARLAATLQMCDSGIAPGSGVGNHRTALSKETLGVPVIAVGVPTVVDAATVGADVLEEYFNLTGEENSTALREQILGEVLKNGSFNYFVTPKNADVVSKTAARLIAMSANKALNPDLSYSDMAELT